jgi:hypothetical protein
MQRTTGALSLALSILDDMTDVAYHWPPCECRGVHDIGDCHKL